MASQLRGYLKTLEKRLHLDPDERDEILVELETHIEDRTQDLIDEGKSSDEAVQDALSGLGRAEKNK